MTVGGDEVTFTNIQDGNTCTWNPTGSLMMGQKDFVVKPFKINEL